jgi:hypothetical protein
VKYAFCVCLFLVACKAECTVGGEDVSAKVNCKVNNDVSVECVVRQDKGKSEIEVCWDFAGSCPNGSTMKAERTCTKVKDGGTSTVKIPADKITLGGPTCDANPTMTLTNMTINGKPSTN